VPYHQPRKDWDGDEEYWCDGRTEGTRTVTDKETVKEKITAKTNASSFKMVGNLGSSFDHGNPTSLAAVENGAKKASCSQLLPAT
jgi:hypothetical protein